MDIKDIKELTDGLFRKLLGIILVIGGSFFLWEAAFESDGKYTGEVLGFVMGTALTTVIGFYYHTSQGSAEKAKQIESIIEKNGGGGNGQET